MSSPTPSAAAVGAGVSGTGLLLAPYFGYEWRRPYWRWGLVLAALLKAGLLAYLLVILRKELRGAWRRPADLRQALRVGAAAA